MAVNTIAHSQNDSLSRFPQVSLPLASAFCTLWLSKNHNPLPQAYLGCGNQTKLEGVSLIHWFIHQVNNRSWDNESFQMLYNIFIAWLLNIKNYTWAGDTVVLKKTLFIPSRSLQSILRYIKPRSKKRVSVYQIPRRKQNNIPEEESS